MSKQSLLLVDGDTRSLRVLEVSLRKAGFSVTPALTVKDALDKLELHPPDLIISETSFTSDLDGFELRRRLRGQPDLAEIPFIFLTAETAIENKIRGLELGVDDYLTKPIYIKEIITRINILLQKRQRRGFDDRKDGTRFAGRVTDMPVVDVIQTIEISRKSGVINFTGERGRQAAIYFRDGKVIDAEAGPLQGEDAVYRLLTWNDGEFEVMFRIVRRREAITASSQGLLMEGMRRLDEWSRLLEQLPPLTHRFEVDANELTIRLGEIPDDNNRILRLIDGKRSLIEVIDASDFGDLECLQVVSRLYFEGLLVDLDPHERPRRDTGKPMPLVMVDEAPTPIEEVASGPAYTEHQARTRPGPSSFSHDAAINVDPDAIDEDAVGEQAIEEEHAIQAPLMGAYRHSSLMLIDAAVAAAEAIEPSLFDDDNPSTAEQPVAAVARVKLTTRTTDPRLAVARNMIERTPPTGVPVNGSMTSGEIGEPRDAASAVTSLEADEPPARQDEDFSDIEEGSSTDPLRPRRFAATIRREDSGLRMIGSHGRDRAEASGELALSPRAQAPTAERQRELVTIMPRRITREIPTVQVAESSESAVAKAIEPVALPPASRVSVAGGVTRERGPGSLGRALLIVATLLALGAVYMKCHKHAAKSPVATELGSDGSAHVLMPPLVDATVVPPIDAHITKAPHGDAHVTAAPHGDVHVTAAHPMDATAVHSTDAAAVRHTDREAAPFRDAAVAAEAPNDARTVAVASADAAVRAPRPDHLAVVEHRDAGPKATIANGDHAKDARDLMDKAHDAVDSGDYEGAVKLADQSLKLRKTARTYLIRAQALQRLDRIDEALKSIDGAMDIVADYPPAWELRGMILWSARRFEEARAAMTRYLELDPNGKSAPAIRRLLQEPR